MAVKKASGGEVKAREPPIHKGAVCLAIVIGLVGCGGIANALNDGGVDGASDAPSCLPQPGTILSGTISLGCGRGSFDGEVLIQANGYVGGGGDTASEIEANVEWSCASAAFNGCEVLYTDCTTNPSLIPAQAPGECNVVSSDLTFSSGGTYAQGNTVVDCDPEICPTTIAPTTFLPYP